jgi:hypothetical protein
VRKKRRYCRPEKEEVHHRPRGRRGWSTSGLDEEEGSDATALEEEEEARQGTGAVHLPSVVPPPTQPLPVVAPPNRARADAATSRSSTLCGWGRRLEWEV